MQDGAQPRVSFVLVSFHSLDDLKRSLPLISSGTFPLEIIVVDNAPGDGTALWLREQYPEVKVIANPANTGYAGGNNLGLEAAQGEWVFIMNPDTLLTDGALNQLLSVAEAYPHALINPKLLNTDGTVNACGLDVHFTGITSCRGLNRPSHAFTTTHPIAFTSGAAILAKRRLLKHLGGFDESYFMYLEDVDIAIRARALGYEVLCAAGASVVHDWELDLSPRKFHYIERNRLLTLLKIYRARTLLRLAPALLTTEILTWVYAFMRGPAYVKARLSGYRWLVVNHRAWRASRAAFQKTRGLSDAELVKSMTLSLPFDQLVASPRLAALGEAVMRPLYALLRRAVPKAGV